MVTIISIIIVVALYMMLGIAVVAVAFMLSLFLAIGCALAKRKIAKVRPSERVCPMCGGQRIKFKYVSSGTTGTGRSTRVANVRFASGEKKIQRKNMAYCEDCGYTFDFMTQKDLDEEYKKFNNGEIGSIAATVIFGILFIAVLGFLK